MAKATDIKHGDKVYRKPGSRYAEVGPALGYVVGQVKQRNGKGATEIQTSKGDVIVLSNQKIYTEEQAQNHEEERIEWEEYKNDRATAIKAGEKVLDQLSKTLDGGEYDIEFYYNLHSYQRQTNRITIKTELFVELLKVAAETDDRFANLNLDAIIKA